MPRRKRDSFKRDIGVDPRFHSSLVQKMINVIMECGKKNVARTIVYDALDELVKKNKGDEKKALEYFRKAFQQIIPAVQVRPRRVGGSVYQIPVEVFEVLERSNPIVSINTGFEKKTIRWHEAVVLRRFGIKNHQRGEECFYDARALLLSLQDTYQHAGDLLNSLAKLTIMSDLSLSWDHKEIMANCFFQHLIENQQQDGIAKNPLKDLRLCTDGWERYVLDFVSKNNQYKSMSMADFVLWCRRPENTKIAAEVSNKLYHFSGYMEFIRHQRDRSVQSENDILIRMVYGKTRNPPRKDISSFLGVLWCKSKNCRVLAERVAKEIRILEMTALLQSPPLPTGYHRIVIK